jgi:hypothetical protein
MARDHPGVRHSWLDSDKPLQSSAQNTPLTMRCTISSALSRTPLLVVRESVILPSAAAKTCISAFETT